MSRETKKTRGRQKTNSKIAHVNPTISTVTLNVNVSTNPVIRQRLTD